MSVDIQQYVSDGPLIVQLPCDSSYDIDVGDFLWWDTTNNVIQRASRVTTALAANEGQKKAYFRLRFIGFCINRSFDASEDSKAVVDVLIVDRNTKGLVDAITSTTVTDFGDTYSIGHDNTNSLLYDQQIESDTTADAIIATACQKPETGQSRIEVIFESGLPSTPAYQTRD